MLLWHDGQRPALTLIYDRTSGSYVNLGQRDEHSDRLRRVVRQPVFASCEICGRYQCMVGGTKGPGNQHDHRPEQREAIDR